MYNNKKKMMKTKTSKKKKNEVEEKTIAAIKCGNHSSVWLLSLNLEPHTGKYE